MLLPEFQHFRNKDSDPEHPESTHPGLAFLDFQEYLKHFDPFHPESWVDNEPGMSLKALENTKIFAPREIDFQCLEEVRTRTVCIGDIDVFFARPNQPHAQETIATYLAVELTNRPEVDTVVFLDTAVTHELIALAKELHANDYRVIIRDHHAELGEHEDLVREILQYCDRDSSKITDRATSPGCAELVQLGEFSGKNVLNIVDHDPDGVFTAIDAATKPKEKETEAFPGLKQDCALLDGNPAKQKVEDMTVHGRRMVALWQTLRKTGTVQEKNAEKFELFRRFVASVQGSKEDAEYFDTVIIPRWENQAVPHARDLANKAEPVCNKVFLLDTTQEAEKFCDTGTLFRALIEQGCEFLILKKEQPGRAVQYEINRIEGTQSLFDILMTRKDSEILNEELERASAKDEKRDPNPRQNRHFFVVQPFIAFCKGDEVFETHVLPKLIKHFGLAQ